MLKDMERAEKERVTEKRAMTAEKERAGSPVPEMPVMSEEERESFLNAPWRNEQERTAAEDFEVPTYTFAASDDITPQQETEESIEELVDQMMAENGGKIVQ